MRPFTTERHCHAPRLIRKRLSLAMIALTVAIASAATIAPGQSARAGVDENWVGPAISQMTSERDQEVGQRGRYREPSYGSDDDGVRPQRRTPLKPKRAARPRSAGQVASLARETTPTHLPPLSIIEWARPNKMEVILPPGDVTTARAKEVGPMVASLGREFVGAPPSPKPSLTGDGIRWLATASTDCLAAPLRTVLKDLAAAFGPFTVRWTCRSKAVNRRVGGARRSFHLTGNAVDFNMNGDHRAILAYLKASKLVGGLKHYGRGAFHIDTGPRRTW